MTTVAAKPAPLVNTSRFLVFAAVVIGLAVFMLNALAVGDPDSSATTATRDHDESQVEAAPSSSSARIDGTNSPVSEEGQPKAPAGEGDPTTTSSNATGKTKQGHSHYQELNRKKIVEKARTVADAPLYPDSIDEYKHPYGTCENFRDMITFNYSEARFRHQAYRMDQRKGRNSTRVEVTWLEANTMRKRFDWFVKDRISNLTTELGGSGDAANKARALALSQVKEIQNNFSHKVTFVKERTRIWEHVLPDVRETHRTEHERCHFAMARMLGIFTSVMDKLGLHQWFISHATLLGAVRNGGFIPWDVDIDVVMPRQHITYLRKMWRPELPRDMFLQTERTESTFHMWTGKERAMRLKDRYSSFYGVTYTSYKAGRKYKAKKWHQGAHVDLIPYEKRNGGKQLRILHSYVNVSDVFPLRTICFENMLVQAPNNVDAVLRTFYGDNYMQPESKPMFSGPTVLPCLATQPSPGSYWSLTWMKDRHPSKLPKENKTSASSPNSRANDDSLAESSPSNLYTPPPPPATLKPLTIDQLLNRSSSTRPRKDGGEEDIPILYPRDDPPGGSHEDDYKVPYQLYFNKKF